MRIGHVISCIIVAISQTQAFCDYSAVEYQKAIDRVSAGKELYFSFPIAETREVEQLEPLVSLDRVEGLKVYAYANKKEFEAFAALNREFTVEQNPGDAIDVECSDYKDIQGLPQFDKWPTYEGYINLVKSYQTNYPKLCRTIEIGQSTKNRKVYCVVIKGENNKSPKAKIAQLGAIHGDEVVGTLCSFRMLNQLIGGYLANDTRTKSILDNVEIWYVPFMNPDGTYKGGDNSVKGAQRGNANGVDLNRTFPSMYDDPTGPAEEVETRYIKQFITSNHFTFATDFHGGVNGYIVPYTFGASPAHPDAQFLNTLVKKMAAKTSGGIRTGTAKDIAGYWAKGTLVDYFNIHGKANGYTLEMGPKMIDEGSFNTQWNKFKNMYLEMYEGCMK